MASRSQSFVAELQPAPCPTDIDVPDQVDIWNMFEEAKILVLKKNMAYGSSVFKQGVLTPDVPVDATIRTRLSDKISRILNLMSGCQNSVPSESLLDTWQDAGTYCFLELIWLKRQAAAAVQADVKKQSYSPDDAQRMFERMLSERKDDPTTLPPNSELKKKGR